MSNEFAGLEDQVSVETLVETIRHYLNGHKRIVDGPDGSFTAETPPSVKPALAALDSLTSRLERAERERDEWRMRCNEYERRLAGGVVRAEARAQKAEAELADALEVAKTYRDQFDNFRKGSR